MTSSRRRGRERQARQLRAPRGGVGRRRRGRDHPDPVALYHRVDDAGRAREPLLQSPLADVGAGEEAAPRQFGGEGVRRTAAEQPAFVDQQHGTATLGLVEIGGAEQHRHFGLAGQVIDDLPQLAPRNGIDADGRLVEKQQFGRMHQGAGEPELLLHAARQPPGPALGEREESRHVHELGVAGGAVPLPYALQIGVEVQVLPHAEVFVEPEALWHVADARLHGERIARDVETERFDRSRVGEQQPGDQPHQGRLAGAVGADQAGDGAARRAGGDAVDRHDHPFARAKAAAHAFEPQRRRAFIGLRHRPLRNRAAAPRRMGSNRCARWRASRAATRRARRRRRP